MAGLYWELQQYRHKEGDMKVTFLVERGKKILPGRQKYFLLYSPSPHFPPKTFTEKDIALSYRQSIFFFTKIKKERDLFLISSLDSRIIIIFYHTRLQLITSSKALLLNCIFSSEITKSTPLFLSFGTLEIIFPPFPPKKNSKGLCRKKCYFMEKGK